MKKPAESLRRIGLIANPEKPRCRPAVLAATRLIRRSGREVLVDDATSGMIGGSLPGCGTPGALARQTDLLLVFGGDGTILRIARDIGGSTTPICGVNLGGLGFLTEIPLRRLSAALQQIWRGDYVFDNRPMMDARVDHHPEAALRVTALNDFVISRGLVSRLIDLEVSVDGQFLTRYRCDGLIVGSPTGSTAYSLSAGGAIVSPAAEVFTLTPICPHTLSNRAVIVSLKARISVKVLSRRLETVLAADGQVHTHLNAGDTVTISRSPRTVHLLRLGGSTFFQTLRQKLRWSGAAV